MSWRTVTVVLALFVAALAGAEEKKIAKSEVPQAVLDAVSAKYPQAPMTAFEQDKEGDKLVYEVGIKIGSQKADIAVTPEGKILSEERTITMAEMPDAVKKGFASSTYGKAKVKKIEKVTESSKPDAPTYELVVQQKGKSHELVFAHTGELTKQETKDKADKD